MPLFCTRLLASACALLLCAAHPRAAAGPQQAGQPIFRAGVDLVSVAAVVRDERGRVVRSLTRNDFELIDAGEPRPFVDFQSDPNAPASVTILVDGSGSMAGGAAIARQIAGLLLSHLKTHRDEASLLTFDTRLVTLREFTNDFESIRRGLTELDAFGASSIYDAIAGAAGLAADRAGRRRAVVVITDGSDNASAYTAYEVASIATAIDVPVYVFAVGDGVAQTPAHARRVGARSTALMELAWATGGDFFDAGASTDHRIAVGRVVEELRHQYLMAFEPSSSAGLRRLEIRTRNPELKVRARQWYAAGSSD